MKIILYAFILFFTLVVGAAAFAQSVDFEVQKQAEDFSAALAGNNLPQMGTAWQWDLVRIRVVTDLGIEVPFLSRLSLGPEIEFIFVKQ